MEANGNASQELFERVQAYEETARLQYDVGMTLSSEYFYGMAQAEISSFRLCLSLRDFLRDLKNRVPPSPFKVLILLGAWDFWYLTATFDSNYPLT